MNVPIEYVADEDAIDELMGEEYLTPADCSRLLHVSEQTVNQQIAKGQLQAMRIGGHYRVHKRDATRWVVDNQPLYGAGE